MVNVISFCLYGSHSTYILGMKENIKLTKEFYPDWKVYIYYNKTVPEKYIKEYKELGAVCNLCENVGKNKMNWEGMFWRWMPLDDPDVDVWISRDADSRLSEREAKIVNEFIESGKTLHCIRDHRCHFNCIMGGMFGINNKLFHKKYTFKKVKDIIKEEYQYYKERPYNVDQIFLNDKLWTLLKNDSIAHISNGGRRVFKEDIEISPVGDFIGKQYRLDDTTSEKVNLTSVDMVNKTFRIKNLYTNHCFDIENEKVKLRNVSDSDSQLWKMNDKHKIINISTGKFLDFDNKKDLIISLNDKNTWNIQEGGFIVNNQIKMAIDFKGGLKDKRLEPWLFKFNYSEAQQWEFLEDNSKRVFRIQNPYNKKCFSVENNKVKLTLLDDNNQKQLWKFDKENKLVHVISGKYLDMDQNKDLIISGQSNHTWSMEDGGFIVNSKNMAIDIKGGINDKRNEIWLYKLNYSEAQQWELKDSNNSHIFSVNKVNINYDNIFPITTSIPSEIFVKDIDEVIKNKTKDMYDGIRNRTIGCNYDFSKEEDYYNAYQEAKWGYTKKKNGWDCMRHYEIVANGCLPLFENLEGSPKLTMSSFPKNLLIEAKNKKDTMTEQEYNFYLKKIFNYFKENLTCEKVAEKFLQQIHKNKNKKISEVKILLLHGNQANNYMADMLFVGLRRLLKQNAVDEKKPKWLYKSYTGGAYGNGFTHTKRLDDIDIDRNDIENKIKNKFFDYIIYRKCGGDECELGDYRKKMEHWDIVEKTYNSNEIVFLYGGDKMISEDGHNHLTNHLKYHSKKGLCFVREFTAPDILKYKNFNFTSTISPRLDDYFDQIYIIHLDCLLDRKKSIIEQVNQFGLKNITIIDAINKNDIDIEKMKETDMVAYPGIEACKKAKVCTCNGGGHQTYKYPGRIACMYGHYLVWKDIIKNNHKKCLILEDDFIITKDLHERFDKIYPNFPTDWELIYFSNSRWVNKTLNEKHSTFGTSGKDYNDSFCTIPFGLKGTACYSVTNDCAKKMHDNALPIRAASDGYVGMCIDTLKLINKSYICKQDLCFNGSIGNYYCNNFTPFKHNGNKSFTSYLQKEFDFKINGDEKKNLNNVLHKLVNKYEKTNINELYEKNQVNLYFDQIYIVHLDNFTERKKKMIEQIKKFNLKNITIIDSINKEHIDMEKCKKLNIVAYPGIESCKHDPQCSCSGRGHKTHEFPGRVACYYGHYLAWDDMVKNKYKKCLILEDDFVLNNDFHNKFKTLYTHMPNDWEVILFENRWQINGIKKRYKSIHKCDIIDNDPNFFKTPYGCQDAGCYAITGNTAKILVNKSVPIRAGADAFIGMCMDRYFLIKNFYISKINLSLNGSVAAPGGIYKGYTENTYRISDEKCDNKLLNLELKKLVNKYEKTDINSLYLLENPKTVLILNHNYHHKNKKGLEMICEYLDYNLIYGSEKDIPKADVVYCPSRPFNASKYPNKRFVFGPHLSIFPNGLLNGIHNKNNSVYIQPSPWARDVWTNWKDMDAEKLIPIKSFPFPVEVDLFKPDEHQIKENVFVMFKHRKPEELRFVENFLNNKKISYKTFRYGSYKQDDYIKHLKTCKYGIWIGRHESQGFALHESLSCNVPLLVWNVTNMRQQHGWNGCPDVYGITIPYWSKTCGEYFYKQDEFEKKYNIFLQNLNNYKPREFIKNRVSVKQCAENFKNIFLNEKKTNSTEFKLLTCANKNYFNALKQFINNVKQINIDFDKLIVYDVGLTNDQENELYILQAEYGFYIYKLDFSKYPEHVNLNLEKWSGLNNSYAFKAIVNYNVLQTIDCPLIFLDCGCHFSKESLLNIVKNTKEKGFWLNISNHKNSIESLELNHPDTLKFFNIKNTEITTCLSELLGIDYKNSYAKNIVDEWYKHSINQKVIIPDGANRNNHRNDQTILSCILHNNNYNYNYKYTVGITPWRNKSTSPYYCKYKGFSCFKKQNNAYESLIYTNSLDEAIECYMGRKNISKEILLKNFIIK
jgi:GR25 family glycosyltransferase involved in LPS biosynthesis